MSSEEMKNILSSLVNDMDRQTQIMDVLQTSANRSNFKLDGFKLPTYGGTISESFQLYVEQVEQYSNGRMIEYKEASVVSHMLAVLGNTLRHGAAQWYIMQKATVTSVDNFFTKLEKEFVPADLQERLREQMDDLKKKNCKDLPDYVSKFRHLVTQVKDMSVLDQIMYFLRLGLLRLSAA